MAENEEQAREIAADWTPNPNDPNVTHELFKVVLAALEAAERRGLRRAVQIVQDVADEHVDQDTDAFRELCIVIADLKALAEE